jgi:predicted lysophospholipase L1 biosynthesis ABC-type transport system permease subunit
MEVLNKILSLVLGIVGVVILINVGFNLSPELVDAVATLNVTGVTMGSVITLVAGYLPFLFLISLVIGAIVLAVKAAD